MLMLNLKRFKVVVFVHVCSAFIFISSTKAQKYKTFADTAKLNKEYGQISLDIAKLNTKLLEEQNKTADFHSKSASTAKEAVSSGQDSRDQASIATDGNTTDTKKALKNAKKADQKANAAKDAISEETNNSKKINQLNAQIAKKQKQLDDLDKQRAEIMNPLRPTEETAK